MTNKDFFSSSWERNSAITAKAFRSLPSDMSKLNYRHIPKFRSPWELVNHIGPHAQELCQAIKEGRMDLVNEGMFNMNAPHIYKTPEDAAKAVEENSAKLLELLKTCDDNSWENKQVAVYWGTMKIMEMSLMQICWDMLNDTIHHRGELASYYRVIGVKQPNLMGPTTEEEEEMMARSASH
ncbi:MAG TPA: DinB family protein [Chitinophagales bacterium]|nr:DinB family protein [Chitinophagales bacterium]